ncbi:universal stress protein [Sphingobium subterraneum]|uniref:Nucleotide-binding universal stress UspA family protein n=1 Tax=Sphingobium subterraneum TaxID=627688 RepID=A0A841J8S7_9SPHN|nr:nucleotide-binding universal stress UspA family protein [Sphingobium subterraneum]
MKSILLHVHDDSGFDHRLQIALDIARTFGAHLHCLQVSPIQGYGSFAAVDGIYAAGIVLEELHAIDSAVRERIEAKLQGEDVAWSWRSIDGDVVQELIRCAALADLVILGQGRPAGPAEEGLTPLAIVEDVSVAVHCGVLAVPVGCRRLDLSAPIVVGWNGSIQAAHALRQAVPILRRSSAVHIVSVGDDTTDFPQLSASTYCARHGVKTELHVLPGKVNRADDVLARFAAQIGAGAIVMGAFGRSRLREAVLGGTTRALLDTSAIPLLLGH